ncbi:MAG TPA: aspartate/glutamate racemase family protein [Terriglobales bacterium]|nr:aspartate/glutamate racemase family protein [Terriglobales bacterium]
MSQKSTAKRILYLVPAPMSRGPFGASELTRRQRLLNERAWGGFRFEVRDTDEGPFTIESIVDEQLSVPGTLRAAVQAEHNGFSAIVLGCFADPGSDAARALLRIPVVGPAEVSLHLACQLGNRYAILTTSEGVVPLIEKVVRHLRLEQRMAGIRTVGTTVLHVADDRKAMLNRLERAGRLALDTDGADVLVLGCMSVSFLNVAPDLSRRLGVPVVCPLAAAVEFAQSLVRCGLSHSKKAFPVPAQSVSAAAG